MTEREEAAAKAVSELMLQTSDDRIREACYRFLCALSPMILEHLELKLDASNA